MKDHTKRAITHDLALSVGDLLGLAGQSILDLLPNHLYRVKVSVSPQLKSEWFNLTTHAQTREQPGSTL